MARKKIPAVAYLRTSSQTNANKPGLAADKDSDKRQRAAVTGFAAANGYEIVDEFYDVVSGADPIDERPGFKAMLDRIAGNGVRIDPRGIPRPLRPRPDRCSSPVTTTCKTLGVELVPASAPDYFLTTRRPRAGAAGAGRDLAIREDLAGRQAEGGARSQEGGHRQVRGPQVPRRDRCPELVAMAKQLRRKLPKGGQLSLREVAAELAKRGFVSKRGTPYSSSAIASMLEG